MLMMVIAGIIIVLMIIIMMYAWFDVSLLSLAYFLRLV